VMPGVVEGMVGQTAHPTDKADHLCEGDRR
jgi:hypothetical protein